MDALRSYLIKNDAFLLGRRKIERTSFYLSIVAAVLLLSFVWMSVFEIDRVVRVEGKVIPTGHSRPIQHLEGGIVSQIETKEGAVVKKGDVLLVIDATVAGANLNETKIKLVSQKAKAARLRAEVSQKDEVVCPDEITSADACLAEKDLFRSNRSKLESGLKVHQETIKQHKASLDEASNRSKSLADELVVAQKRVKMLEGMAERKAASQIELLEAQSRERRLLTEMQDTTNSKPKVAAALAAEQARAGSILADFKSDAQKELVQVLAEIDKLSETVSMAADRLNRTEIRAPIDGTINRLSVTTAGAVVKPGETVIELTPTSENLQVEARVAPKDRGELTPGIAARVRVSAYDVASLGVLTGLLNEISADTMPDAKGESYYRAKIGIDTLPDAYSGKPVLPGMTVTGDLVIGKRSILRHILSPMIKFSHNMFRDSR